MPRCLNCKDKFTPKTFLQKHCMEKDECVSAFMEWKDVQIKKNNDKKWKEEKKVIKDNVTNWKDVLQTEINRIVKYIDKNQLCLARNISGQMHAGHVYARGGNSTIRFNLHNIHRQCAQSNHFQNDDGLLREGITKEYGEEYMSFISELRRTPQLEYKPIQYKEMSIKAKSIANSLNKIDEDYSLKNRILLRNKINLQLGIYQEEFCTFAVQEWSPD